MCTIGIKNLTVQLTTTCYCCIMSSQGLEVTVRIASALQDLLLIGHYKYRRFERQYSLHSEGINDHLLEMAKDMENDLEEWRTTVKKLRSKYYHMNYFTTRQLSVICQELSTLHPVTHHIFEPWFLSLLQSVCPVLDIDRVARAIVIVAKERETVKKGSFFGIASSSNSVPLVETKGYEEPKDAVSKAGPLQSMCTQRVLKVDDLNETQQELFEELCAYEFSKELVLIALTEKGCNFDDLYDYCLKFSSLDVDQGTKGPSAVPAEIFAQDKEPVLPLNENHPLVRERIDSGSDVKLAMDTAEVCKCNKKQMFDYSQDMGSVSDTEEENEPK